MTIIQEMKVLNNELEIGEIQVNIRNIYYGSKKMTKDIALKECKLMINSYRRKMEQADKARRYHIMKIHYHNLQNQIRENQIKHFETEIEDIKKYGDYNEQ
ncbi:MAG: hypothetical protein K2P53_05625 [Rickettsiales bacterium]|nr:hypothetical protein [Rickettsiales bacterium]